MGKIYYVHPKTYDTLIKGLPALSQSEGMPILGIELRKSEAVPEFHKTWEFPKSPHVQYDKSDEKWAIPMGFGKWVETCDRVVFGIDEVNFTLPINMDYYA